MVLDLSQHFRVSRTSLREASDFKAQESHKQGVEWLLIEFLPTNDIKLGDTTQEPWNLTWTPRNHGPGYSLFKRLLNLGVPTSRKWNDVWTSSAANMWRCDIRCDVKVQIPPKSLLSWRVPQGVQWAVHPGLWWKLTKRWSESLCDGKIGGWMRILSEFWYLIFFNRKILNRACLWRWSF